MRSISNVNMYNLVGTFRKRHRYYYTAELIKIFKNPIILEKLKLIRTPELQMPCRKCIFMPRVYHFASCTIKYNLAATIYVLWQLLYPHGVL